MKILECKESKQQKVLPVFYKVEPSTVRHQQNSFKDAFDKHEDRFKDDAKVQRWKTALKQAAGISVSHLMINENESEFIEEIIQEVSRMKNDHFFLPVAKHPVGLEPRLKDLNLLLSIETNDIRMIGIFGVGGIGKTTLAKAIYNSIAFRFEARCFLATVSDTSNQADRLVQLQQTLLFKILGECKSLEIDDVDTAIIIIRRVLHSKRVLLILDDVDHLCQLEILAGAHDWFGKGSRIIITTRDQHLLTTHGVDSTYEMMRLNQNDAFQLFCWHAFKREIPDDGFGEFVEWIVNYAGRLPLALTVLGSDLYGRTKEEWVSAMDEYRQIPHQDIQKILQTSYDRLSENEKNVFLYIACFFNGQVRLDDVIREILVSFGFRPNFTIPKLMEKCLISECRGKLQMHSLLRDMGREVVRRESPNNPGACSRLFFHNHVQEVLQEDTNLTVMNFRGCGRITELSDVSRCPNLKKINLRDCTSLVKVHDYVGLLDELVQLNLSECSNLSFPRRLQLRSLGFLDLVVSTSKENPVSWVLPLSPPTESTTDLELHLKNSGLSKSNLFDFDYFFGPFHFFLNLTVLDLSGSDIVSIPARIEILFWLRNLILNDCRQLKEIKKFPRSLSVLRANGCISLESLPKGSNIFPRRRLRSIKLARCYKVNIGNLMPYYISPHVQLNSAWPQEADMIFPGNEIPFWFSNCKETSNDYRCEFDIKGSPPYNFDGLIGIALCAVIEPVGRFWSIDMMIGSVAYDSDHYVGKFDEMDSDHVWLRYFTLEDFKLRRGIRLDQEDNLRIIFESNPKSVILKRCGVHLFYKRHE